MRAVRSIVSVACLLVACGAGQEAEEERFATVQHSAHINLGTVNDGRICAGTLDRLEHHAQRLEQVLGLTYREPVEVYLDPDLIDCGGIGASGCWNIEHRFIRSMMGSVEHELVHALFYDYSQSADYLSEGAAVAYSDDECQRARLLPSQSLGLAPSQLDYSGAGHFSRWLAANYGAESLVRWQRTQPETPAAVRAEFAKVYGAPLEEIEQLYWSDAPSRYSSLQTCESRGKELSWNGAMLQADILLDCDDESVWGLDSMATDLYFRVEEAGYYYLSLGSADNSQVSSTLNYCYGSAPSDEPPAGEELVPEAWSLSGSWFRPGLYRFTLYGAGTDPISVRFALLPTDRTVP
jgi:hypothetical protein